MSTTPEQQKSADPALSAFGTSLIFDTVVFVAAVLAFGFIRTRVRHIFSPRTYFVAKEKRSPVLPPSLNPLTWILPVMRVDDSAFLAMAGLDHYLFMRYLRMCFRLFTVSAVVGLSILGPISVVDQGPTYPPSLKLITIGNITTAVRFWAPTVLSVIFTIGTLWMLRNETREFLRVRQEYLRQNATAPFLRVVMLRDVPPYLLRSRAIKKLFEHLPGGIERVYLARDPGPLPSLIRDRNKVLARLESVEAKYIRSFGFLGTRKSSKALKRHSRRRQTQPHVPPLSLIRLRELEPVETRLSIEVPSVSSVSATGTTRTEAPLTESSHSETSGTAGMVNPQTLSFIFENAPTTTPSGSTPDPAHNLPQSLPLKSSLRTSSTPRVRPSMARFANPPATVVTDSPPPKRFQTIDMPARKSRATVLTPRFSSLRSLGSIGVGAGRIGRGRRRRPSLRGLGVEEGSEGVELRTRESSSEDESASHSRTEEIPPQHQHVDIDLSDLPPRPTIRTRLFATPIDAIRHYRIELLDMNKRVGEARAALTADRISPPFGVVFVLFKEQLAAQMCLMEKEGGWRGKEIGKRIGEVAPRDIVWENLRIGKAEKLSRRITGGTITAVLIVFWGVLVAGVTALANLDTLRHIIPPINYLLNISPVITGFIQGLIPSMVLSLLMGLLPIFLIYLCRFEGIATRSRIERAVQSRYFFFLIVNVLLVVTVAGTILQSFGALFQHPDAIVNILATSLPTASTFMINYILLQGLIGGAIEILQIYRLIFNWIWLKLFCDTPRKIFMENHTRAFLWGTVLPQQALIFSIGATFSSVAPLILASCAIYFAIFYLIYRHQILYVYTTSHQTGGLHYPLALMQPITGLIIHLLMMIGIMFLRGAIGQGVICILMLILVVLALIYGRWKYKLQALFSPDAIAAPRIRRSELRLSADEYDEVFEREDGKVDDYDDEESRDPVAVELSRQDEALLREVTDQVDPHDTDMAFRNLYAWDNEPSGSGSASGVKAPRLPPLAIHRRERKGAVLTSLYLHPYLTMPPPKVWLPHDVLGVAESEAAELTAMGLEAMVDGGTGDGSDGGNANGGNIIAEEEAVKRREEISRQVEQIDASVAFPQIIGGGTMNWFH